MLESDSEIHVAPLRVMGQDARFEKWASGILGVVSLLLALHLARSYVPSHRAESHARVVAHHVVASHVKPQEISPAPASTPRPEPREVLREVDLPARHSAPPAAVASRRDSRVKLTAQDANSNPVVVAQTSAPPPPATKEFQTIGYVEKPDGTRQAVISEGSQVFVVHDGEIFDEHYRVLSISASTVEAADLTVPQPAPTAMPSEPVLLAQLAKPVDTSPTADSAKPLGYVERPGRPPESIVSDRDGVRLVPQSSEADGSLVARAQPAPAPTTTPTSVVSSDLSVSAGLPAEVNPAPADGTPLPRIVAVNAKASGSMTNKNDGSGELALDRPPLGEKGSNSPQSDGTPLGNPPETSYQILKAFCYAEGEESGRQAFVAFGNSVYSVREGTTLADRYRVLKISPQGVEVADAGAEIRPPPPSGEEFAQNGIRDNETPELGNHSPPAELPWNVFVRSVSFHWSNSATTGGSFGAEPALFAKIRSEPTSEDSGSSTLLVGVGPPPTSLNDNSILSSATSFEGSSAKKDQAGSIQVLTSTNVMANGPGESARTPPLDGTYVNGSSSAGNSAPVIASSAALYSAPILTLSGRDLLLPFSVSDNGCSIP